GLAGELRVLGQLAVLDAGESFERADPERAVAGSEQGSDVVRWESLARRRPPLQRPDAIETQQPQFGAKPKIPIAGLRKRRDESLGKSVASLPRGVRVLTDVEPRIEREGGGPADDAKNGQHHSHDDARSSRASRDLGHVPSGARARAADAFAYAIDAGIVSSISVPASRSLHTVNLPPSALARSCMPGSP